MNFPFEKKFGEPLAYTGGVAGIWAMHIFGSTYFDKISIFGLPKEK
jgi:hypothetical protein